MMLVASEPSSPAVFHCPGCGISWRLEISPVHVSSDHCPRCGRWIWNEDVRGVHPPSPAATIMAIVVLTSAASTTALAYFQALAQEAARDTYEFLKRRLKPGDSLSIMASTMGMKRPPRRRPARVTFA